jgi:thiamine kinase-like enzyme
MVSSHNDLKPENILFDGARVWLVDWEAAFLNDRYFDLVVVANFVVTDDAEEEAYLRRYFGEAAGEYRLARFYLMRQITHMSCAMVFLRLGSGGKAIEPNAKVPRVSETSITAFGLVKSVWPAMKRERSTDESI